MNKPISPVLRTIAGDLLASVIRQGGAAQPEYVYEFLEQEGIAAYDDIYEVLLFATAACRQFGDQADRAGQAAASERYALAESVLFLCFDLVANDHQPRQRGHADLDEEIAQLMATNTAWGTDPLAP